MSFRLLPKDPKFFELFIADGENLRRRPVACTRWSTSTTGSTSASPRSRRSRSAATRSTARSTGASRTRSSRRSTARTSTSSTVRLDDVRRRDPGDRRDLRDLRRGRRRPRRRRRLAAILDGQAVELVGALRELDGLKGLEPHLQAIHDLENEADGLSRAADRRGCSTRPRTPIDVIKWRDLYTALENTIDAAEDAAEAMERMYHKAT